MNKTTVALSKRQYKEIIKTMKEQSTSLSMSRVAEMTTSAAPHFPSLSHFSCAHRGQIKAGQICGFGVLWNSVLGRLSALSALI